LSEDYTDGVIVEAELMQVVRMLCPRTGEERELDRRAMAGLSKEQLLDYGSDWLDVTLPGVPAGWLVSITQGALLTSAQAAHISDRLGGEAQPWRPVREASTWARAELQRWSDLKRWGGSR
jgi:hypothetical protein